jgi:tagatose 6-phosphate kinase
MFLAVCPNPSVDTYVWVSSLEPGKVHRALKEKRFPGGKGVHVAMAAAELGEEVTLIGFWGGETGRWIKKECEKRSIRCIGPELQEWSRICFTFKSNGILDDTELLGSGPEVPAAAYREFIHIFNEQVRSSKIITMSGSWPEGVPPTGYEEMIKKANEFSKPVFLDAMGEPFKRALNSNPFGIHLNLSESRKISGLSDIREIIDYFRKKVDVVALTSGKDGLFLGADDRILHGKIYLEKIYSAVGSGDCLTAGLAIGIMNKMKVEEMVKLGVACGGANCLREDLGMLHKQDVERLLPDIEMNPNW